MMRNLVVSDRVVVVVKDWIVSLRFDAVVVGYRYKRVELMKVSVDKGCFNAGSWSVV